jgi:hypothetical protein
VFTVLATGRFIACVHTLYAAVFDFIKSGNQVLLAYPRTHTAMLAADEFVPLTVDTVFIHVLSDARLG